MADEATESGSSETSTGAVPTAAIDYAKPSTPHPPVSLASGITRGDIAALAVRLAGIYLIIAALPTLVVVAFSGFGRSGFDSTVGIFIPFCIAFIGVGAFLIVKAALIGSWLLPRVTAGPDVAPTPGSVQQLQAVALSVVGVVLAASSLPQLAWAAEQFTHSSRGLLEVTIRPAAELIVGLLLFFRSKRISGYWERIPAAPPDNADSGPL
jgi:hypothetical protein